MDPYLCFFQRIGFDNLIFFCCRAGTSLVRCLHATLFQWRFHQLCQSSPTQGLKQLCRLTPKLQILSQVDIPRVSWNVRPCVPKTRKGRRGNAPRIWSWHFGARQLRFWSPPPIQDRRANSWRALSCYCIICAGCRDIETKPLSFRWLEYGRWVAVLRLPPLWSWKSLKSFWQQQPWRFRQSPKKLSLIPRQLGQAEKPCDAARCLLSHRSVYWVYTMYPSINSHRHLRGRRRGRKRESARERERWRYDTR